MSYETNNIFMAEQFNAVSVSRIKKKWLFNTNAVKSWRQNIFQMSPDGRVLALTLNLRGKWNDVMVSLSEIKIRMNEVYNESIDSVQGNTGTPYFSGNFSMTSFILFVTEMLQCFMLFVTNVTLFHVLYFKDVTVFHALCYKDVSCSLEQRYYIMFLILAVWHFITFSCYRELKILFTLFNRWSIDKVR